jgi:hypothetical protein
MRWRAGRLPALAVCILAFLPGGHRSPRAGVRAVSDINHVELTASRAIKTP